MTMLKDAKHAHTEGARDDSEARLRRVLDTVVAFVGTLTPDGILTEANEPALLAADLAREDVIGKPFWDCYWWSYSAEVQEQLRNAVERAASGETVRYDVDVRVAGGALITVDFQLAPNFDQYGNVIELIPSGVDITERKQVEEQLRRSSDTFSKLVKDAPFGVYLVDSQFRLAQISAGSQKVFSGVRPLLGRDFAEILRILWPEPFASEAIERFRHTLATGVSYRSADTLEQRADIAELEAYDWQIERVTLPDGQFGVVCYFYDLTAQKRAEAAVRESEARQRQILDNVNAFVGLLDTAGIVTEANSASVYAAGVSREEVIGKPFADAPWWTSSPDQQKLRDIVARARVGETIRRDLVYSGSEGQTRWVDFQIAPVLADDGAVLAVVPSGVDITERKQIEQSLAESAAAYRLALTAARSGAWQWDIVEDRVEWSPELGEILAISRDNFPRTVAEFLSLLPEEDQAAVQSVIDAALSGGENYYEIECRIRRGDNGKFQWVRAAGEILRAEDGTARCIRGLASDIDELRRVEQVAREGDARIQNLLNSTAEGIYGVDQAGNCTFANPACARILGYESPSEFIGRNMHDLVHHHHADWTPYPSSDCSIYQSFRTGERIHVDDEVFWRRDGSSFPVEYWSNPIAENGEIVGSVVTFFDITARRQAELDLRTAAERLSLALDVGKMGVWDWDMRTGAVEWSDYHYSLAGYKVGEVIPSYEAWRARVHPDDLQKVEAKLDHAKKNRSIYESTFRFKHPDGSIFHVMARGRFFYDDAGQPIRMIGVLDDITELKAAEQYRELLMGELDHRVKNTLATIQAMAAHTLRSAPNPQSFRETFNGRLRAIASAHEILFANAEGGARLTDLISRQVGPYADLTSDQVQLDGPDVRLDPATAHALGLVLHELATNASKYGALSHSSGHIAISWKTKHHAGSDKMHLIWRERGGPRVIAPAKQGFGTRLIEQTITHSLAGELEFRYDSAGLTAVLIVPMERDNAPADTRADP
jgi:PAS domain S-box-containing protein